MAVDEDPGIGVETFSALQSLLVTMEGIEDFLQDVARLAANRVLPGLLSCGITARYDGRPVTVASSDGAALRLDESQYGVHEGTCLQAMETGETVYVPDARTEEQWPDYMRAARDQGLRSSLSVPLLADGRSMGALNLYDWDGPDAFGGEARAAAESFAAAAAMVLLLALRHVERVEQTRQLETALRSRSVIDQAMGVIMGQQGCSADDAFAILRAHSQHNNRKLRAVATELVSSLGAADRDDAV